MPLLKYVNNGVPHPLRGIFLDKDMDEIILGRGSASEKERFIKSDNLCFDERTMSKAHCLVKWDVDGSGKVTIKDLNSFHGTCVVRGEDKVFFNPTEPLELESGDIIGLVFTNKNLEDSDWNVFKDSKIQLKFVYIGLGAFAVCHLSRTKCLEDGLSFVSSMEMLDDPEFSEDSNDTDMALGQVVMDMADAAQELHDEPDLLSASYTDDELELEAGEAETSSGQAVVAKHIKYNGDSSEEESVDSEETSTRVPDAFDYETSSDEESYEGILVGPIDDYMSSEESDSDVDDCDCFDCAGVELEEPSRKRKYEITDETEFYMPPKKTAKPEQPAVSSWFQTIKAATVGAIIGSVGTVSILAAIGQSLEN